MELWAAKENIQATDPRFQNIIKVSHEDGSRYELPDAFSVDDPEDEEFFWVITEHQGYFVFSYDEAILFEIPYNLR
jgi:hypothetical protein